MFSERGFSPQRMAVYDLIRRSKDDHASVGGWFEWDVTDTVARIERDRARGREVGLAAYMIKATATVMRAQPRLNRRLFRRWFRLRDVRWDEVSCNLVVARPADTEERWVLLPAVVRHADRMPIEEIHALVRTWKTAELGTLEEARAIDRVRTAPRLLVKLYGWMIRRNPTFFIARHGTYNLSMIAELDLGAIAAQAVTPSTSFYPGPITERPAVRDGAIVVRKMMTFGMLADHYLVDGMDLLHAVRQLKQLVEEPEHLLGPEPG